MNHNRDNVLLPGHTVFAVLVLTTVRAERHGATRRTLFWQQAPHCTDDQEVISRQHIRRTIRDHHRRDTNKADMVLGLLVITAIPTVTGVAEAISSKKQQNAQMKEKIKFNMTATLSIDGGLPTEAWVVLYGGRVSSVLSFLKSSLHRQESCFLTFSFVIITSPSSDSALRVVPPPPYRIPHGGTSHISNGIMFQATAIPLSSLVGTIGNRSAPVSGNQRALVSLGLSAFLLDLNDACG